MLLYSHRTRVQSLDETDEEQEPTRLDSSELLRLLSLFATAASTRNDMLGFVGLSEDNKVSQPTYFLPLLLPATLLADFSLSDDSSLPLRRSASPRRSRSQR